jgi:transposase-like protein
MGNRVFSAEQIKDLLKNPNVAKCSSKSISCSNQFKVWAVKQYCEQGLPARQIFVNAGFNLAVIGDDIPKSCLKRWRKIFKSKGAAGLAIEHRGKTPGGGRPRTKGLTDTEKIKRLEATVAYLKAENDFLVKLRGQRKS